MKFELVLLITAVNGLTIRTSSDQAGMIMTTSPTATAITHACLSRGVFCGGFAGPVGECCSGLTCSYKLLDFSTCAPAPKPTSTPTSTTTKLPDPIPVCLPKNALCSGFAGPLGKCCAGLTCISKPGEADNAHCLPESLPLCLPKNALCSGFAGPVGKCCAGLKCVSKPGEADNAHCLPAPVPVCLPRGALCSGFAGPLGKCCPGLKCSEEDGGADNAHCK